MKGFFCVSIYQDDTARKVPTCRQLALLQSRADYSPRPGGCRCGGRDCDVEDVAFPCAKGAVPSFVAAADVDDDSYDDDDGSDNLLAALELAAVGSAGGGGHIFCTTLASPSWPRRHGSYRRKYSSHKCTRRGLQDGQIGPCSARYSGLLKRAPSRLIASQTERVRALSLSSARSEFALQRKFPNWHE